MESKKEIKQGKFTLPWLYVILLVATLGLAPYTPEPHVWGKVKWILGGAKNMQILDWGDFLMHGFPWILLGAKLFSSLKQGKNSNPRSLDPSSERFSDLNHSKPLK